MLTQENIRIIVVQGIGSSVPFASRHEHEHALFITRAKVRVFGLIEYKAIIFFDSDFLFHNNCDDFFESDLKFLARSGKHSPLNAGFFLLKPSLQTLADINDISLSLNFDPDLGWMEYGAITDWRNPRRTMSWRFMGSTTDQGLLYFYFMIYMPNGSARIESLDSWFDKFAHFAGGDFKPERISNIGNIPAKHRKPAIAWFLLLSNVQKKLKLKLSSQIRRMIAYAKSGLSWNVS